MSRPGPLPSAEQVDRRLRQMLAADSLQSGDGARTSRLMLMLTRSCELRCAYCFVALSEAHAGIEHAGVGHPGVGRPNAEHPGAGHPGVERADGPGGALPEGDLSLATARLAIDVWMRSPKPRLGLQLFGGEPTRRWDTLVAAVDYALGHPARAGREVEVQLTTNGLGLSSARATILAERGVVVQVSVDGAGADNRFRRPHQLAEAEVEARWAAMFDALRESGVQWFLNITVPPSAAGEVEARYRSARALGAPGLQLNYATGMRWTEAQIEAWLYGLRATLQHDHLDPGPLRLYNWQNAADPAPLCGDVIVDVDGTLLQVGGIFHERRFPALRKAYRHGSVAELADFGARRASLAELWSRTQAALAPEELAIFLQGMRIGAAQDLVCRTVALEVGRVGPRPG